MASSDFAVTDDHIELLCHTLLGRDCQLFDESPVHVAGLQGNVELLEEWPRSHILHHLLRLPPGGKWQLCFPLYPEVYVSSRTECCCKLLG